jgi:predicted nucleotidyltransferase
MEEVQNPMRRSWDLIEACAFIRIIAPELLRAGWGVGLTGSVLLHGFSRNDLDIIVYPQSKQDQELEKLYQVLSLHCTLEVDYDMVQASWRRIGSKDTKRVQVWRTPNGKKLDVFILE